MNLQEILAKHKLWLENKEGGERAGFQYADLRHEDLSRCDLRGVNFRYANLQHVNLSHTKLEGADLTGAVLRYANLYCADLKGADLQYCIGDDGAIRTIHTGRWTIVYTNTDMAIGCEQHSVADWMAFDDERITDMEVGALEFWRKWKPILKLILEI